MSQVEKRKQWKRSPLAVGQLWSIVGGLGRIKTRKKRFNFELPIFLSVFFRSCFVSLSIVTPLLLPNLSYISALGLQSLSRKTYERIGETAVSVSREELRVWHVALAHIDTGNERYIRVVSVTKPQEKEREGVNGSRNATLLDSESECTSLSRLRTQCSEDPG